MADFKMYPTQHPNYPKLNLVDIIKYEKSASKKRGIFEKWMAYRAWKLLISSLKILEKKYEITPSCLFSQWLLFASILQKDWVL